MYSSQNSVLQTIKLLEKKNRQTAAQNPDAPRIANDLDTLRRLIQGMSERAYRVHIEDEAKPNSFFKRLAATTAIIILFSIAGLGQSGYDVSKLQKVDAYTVTSFSFAHCQNEFDTMYTLPSLPIMIRSQAVGSVYEFNEFVPFKVYWTPWERPLNFDDSYFLSSGRCRGFSFSLAAKYPGIYTIIFEHPEKPCVMQLTVTPKDMHQDGHLVEMRFFQRCRPAVVFRRYEARDPYLNLPEGQALDIEVFWKADDGKKDFQTERDGFELLKTVHTNTSHRFKYELGEFGVYWFRMKSPADRYYFNNYVRIRPDDYEECGGVSLN